MFTSVATGHKLPVEMLVSVADVYLNNKCCLKDTIYAFGLFSFSLLQGFQSLLEVKIPSPIIGLKKERTGIGEPGKGRQVPLRTTKT